MAIVDIARDLANAANKTVNSANTLINSPTPLQEFGAEIAKLSAAANTASALTNALKTLIPKGIVQGVSVTKVMDKVLVHERKSRIEHRHSPAFLSILPFDHNV